MHRAVTPAKRKSTRVGAAVGPTNRAKWRPFVVPCQCRPRHRGRTPPGIPWPCIYDNVVEWPTARLVIVEATTPEDLVVPPGAAYSRPYRQTVSVERHWPVNYFRRRQKYVRLWPGRRVVAVVSTHPKHCSAMPWVGRNKTWPMPYYCGSSSSSWHRPHSCRGCCSSLWRLFLLLRLRYGDHDSLCCVSLRLSSSIVGRSSGN